MHTAKAVIHQYRPNFDWHELLELLCPADGRSEFESALAARVGARFGIAFAYGRSGIIAACKALGLTQAEIIVPAFTCGVIPEAVAISGNRPIFVDIDLADYNMDINAIKRVITPQTRAIIATHMYGYPADIEAIRTIAGDERIVIIEDSALLGPVAGCSGEAGIRGDIALYSFGPGKHLYTVQGGILVTNSATLYEKIKACRDQDMSRLPWKVWAKRLARLMTGYMMLNSSMLEAWNKVNQIGPMKRVRGKLGLKHVNMPADYATAFANFQGRVGLAQLRKFDSILDKHRAWAKLYTSELRDVPGITPAPIIPGATYSLYTIRVEGRDEINFRRCMLARGIEVGTVFNSVVADKYPFHPYMKGTFPCAEQAAREVVNLPNYAGLSIADARYIVESSHAISEELRSNDASLPTLL
jgi:perosamine synthetase